MKSKVKIIRTEKGYVGRVLNGDSVVHETPPCRDSITASRALSNYIGTHPANANTHATIVNSTTLQMLNKKPPSGECCGR